MFDFQIVSAKVVLPVYSISPIRGFLPMSIVVVGSQFDTTKEVFYNDTLADEIIISSSTRMIVRVPSSQVGKPFISLRVYSNAMLTRQDSVLSLVVERPTKKVSGLQRLVQTWVMVFLTTPGSDIFQQDSGGGARDIIGRTTDKRGKGITTDLAQAIEKTKTELLRIQSRRSNLPLEEKILNSTLDGVAFDDRTTTLLAKVSLQNMLGQAAEMSLKG